MSLENFYTQNICKMISKEQMKMGKEIMADIKSKIKTRTMNFITCFFPPSYSWIFSLKKFYQM